MIARVRAIDWHLCTLPLCRMAGHRWAHFGTMRICDRPCCHGREDATEWLS